jgi:hypothetical protein
MNSTAYACAVGSRNLTNLSRIFAPFTHISGNLVIGNLRNRTDNIRGLFALIYRQSNCFLVGFGFAFNLIEVEPIFQQSSVVCLIH